jgi:hypothetical protein
MFLLQEFNLIDRRELAPLQELIEKLTAKECRWNGCNSFLPSEHLLTLLNRLCATTVAMLHSNVVSDWNKQMRALLWTTEFTNASNSGIHTQYMITADQDSLRSEHILQSYLCHIKIIIFWKEYHLQIIFDTSHEPLLKTRSKADVPALVATYNLRYLVRYYSGNTCNVQVQLCLGISSR